MKILGKAEKKYHVKVLCDCGNEFTAYKYDVAKGHTKSCGCLSNAKDYTGMRFGRLVAVKPTEKRVKKAVVWILLCDCGNEIERADFNSKNKALSCGCLKIERSRENAAIARERMKVFPAWAYTMNAKNRHKLFISDSYVRVLLSKHYSMSTKDIPAILIDVKRKELKIKRLLKGEAYEEYKRPKR